VPTVSEVETGVAEAVARRLAGVIDRGRQAEPTGDRVGAAPAVQGVVTGPAGGGGAATRLAGLGAFDPGRPGVRALVAVVVVVALGAAVLAWLSRPRPEPVAAVLTAPHPTAAAPGGPPVASPTGAAHLVVAVTGTVRRPGLVRVPAGARVADVIEAAGGLVTDAEVGHLNLARRVADGELIAVGTPAPPGAAPGAGVGPPAAGQPLNLNTATAGELEGLPGVGPVLAQRIVAHREQHGGFRSVEELRQVTGIGEARFAELRDLVTV